MAVVISGLSISIDARPPRSLDNSPVAFIHLSKNLFLVQESGENMSAIFDRGMLKSQVFAKGANVEMVNGQVHIRFYSQI